MKFCAGCGTMMNDDAKFCKVCGASADSPRKTSLEENSETIPSEPNENISEIVETKEEVQIPDITDVKSPADGNSEENNQSQRIRVGGLRIAGASAVSALAVVFMLVFNLILCVKLGLSGEIIAKRIEKLNTESTISSTYRYRNLSDTIYDSLNFSYIMGGSYETEFHHFLSDSNLLEFSADRAEEYLDYIFGVRKSDPSVTADDISDFFRKNLDAAVKNMGRRFNTNDLNLIEANSTELTKSLSVENINKIMGFNVRLLGYMFSYLMLITVFIVVLLLLVWIAIIVDRQGKHLTGFFGNIFFVSGVLTILIPFAIVTGSSIAYSYTSGLIFYLSLNILMPFSAFVLCTGSFEFIVGFIIKMIRRLILKHEKKIAVT